MHLFWKEGVAEIFWGWKICNVWSFLIVLFFGGHGSVLGVHMTNIFGGVQMIHREYKIL